MYFGMIRTLFMFRLRTFTVSRCIRRLQGHTDAVLCVAAAGKGVSQQSGLGFGLRCSPKP